MDVLTHKCPNCGGPLTFDPKDQKFHCDYCLSIFTEAEVTAFEEQQKQARMTEKADQPEKDAEDFTFTAAEQSASMSAEEKAAQKAAGTAEQTAEADDKLELFLCPSCGAEIATDQTTAATYCYFCHNPVVLSGRLSGEFLPNRVLPFAIEKEEAIDKFLAWTRRKRFIPKDFFDKKQIEKLTGVYFPYWVVDAKTAGQLEGMGTTIRVWVVGDIEYTETKQFQVSRAGDITFSELVKNALSKNVQQKMVESVQPFPLEKAVAFKSQYLAGFQAEKRDIEFATIKEAVASELKEYAGDLLRDTVNGYTTFKTGSSSITIQDSQNHYMLLPVWLVTYKNRGSDKVYYYAMNGQSGKVSGVLPISRQRLGLTAAGIFTALAAIGMIVGYFI